MYFFYTFYTCFRVLYIYATIECVVSRYATGNSPYLEKCYSLTMCGLDKNAPPAFFLTHPISPHGPHWLLPASSTLPDERQRRMTEVAQTPTSMSGHRRLR